jgi:hypothetical protein
LSGRDDLHQVVDDDVADGADRVVEVAAVLDAERLGHRDLHRRHVVPVPDRLQHRVGEAQEEQLLQAHLAQEVVDPQQLRLVQVAMQFRGQRPRRIQVVAERLLDDHPGVPDESGLGQALDHHREQRGRNLQIEHRAPGVADRGLHTRVGVAVGEVAADVREPRRQAGEDLRVDRLAACLDAVVGMLAELLHRPVVDRNTDDRALQQAARLQAIERMQRHHLGQVAGDAEHDQHIRRSRGISQPGRRCSGGEGLRRHAPSLLSNARFRSA